MTTESFAVGTAVRLVREHWSGGITSVLGYVTSRLQQRVEMKTRDGEELAMTLGDEELAPGTRLAFQFCEDVDDQWEVKVGRIVGDRVEIDAPDGVSRYMIVGETVVFPVDGEALPDRSMT